MLATGTPAPYMDRDSRLFGPPPSPAPIHPSLEVRSMSRSIRAALRLATAVPLLVAIAVSAHAQQSKSRAKKSEKAANAAEAANGAAPS